MEINLELDITRECNFQCRSCVRMSNFHNKNPKSVMSTSDLLNISEQFKNNHISINQLGILGGEPTIHPQFKEICLNIKKLFNTKTYLLKTNFSKPELVQWSIQNKITVAHQELMAFSSDEVKKYKNTQHINLYGITKIKNYNYKLILNKCELLNQCGLNIYKYNNVIRYASCPCVSFISRLLGNEDTYTFTTLKECLFFDKNKILENICCYCIMPWTLSLNTFFSNKNIEEKQNLISTLDEKKQNNYIKKHYQTNKINQDFLDGYFKMIKDTKNYL